MTTNRIPLWPGAKVTVTEHGVSWSAHVLGVKSAGVLVAWFAGDQVRLGDLGYFDADQVALDFTDPDTFRGAVARLAERLGAPPEAVAEGVAFECYFRGWMVTAGVVSFPAEDYVWSRSGSLPPANHGADPAEALVAAWAQVLAEVKPCP